MRTFDIASELKGQGNIFTARFLLSWRWQGKHHFRWCELFHSKKNFPEVERNSYSLCICLPSSILLVNLSLMATSSTTSEYKWKNKANLEGEGYEAQVERKLRCIYVFLEILMTRWSELSVTPESGPGRGNLTCVQQQYNTPPCSSDHTTRIIFVENWLNSTSRVKFYHCRVCFSWLKYKIHKVQ